VVAVNRYEQRIEFGDELLGSISVERTRPRQRECMIGKRLSSSPVLSQREPGCLVCELLSPHRRRLGWLVGAAAGSDLLAGNDGMLER